MLHPDVSNSTSAVDWNACDYVLQCNFKATHLAGSVNTAADFLSRLELKLTEKIRLKIWEDIQARPIEVTTSSWDVADGEHLFFTQADNENESIEHTLQRNQRSWQDAEDWVGSKKPSSLETSVKESTMNNRKFTSYSMNGNKVESTDDIMTIQAL